MDPATLPPTVGGGANDGADASPAQAVLRPPPVLHVLFLSLVALVAGDPVRQFMAGEYVEPIGLLRLLIPVLPYISVLIHRIELNGDGVHVRSALGTRHHTWDEVEEVVLPPTPSRWRSAHLRMGRHLNESPSRVDIGGLLSRQLTDDALGVAAEMARRHGIPLRMKTDMRRDIVLVLAAVFTVMVFVWGAVTIYG